MSKIKGINQCNFEFPIVVEGKGTIHLGSKTILKKNAALRVASSSKIELGKESTIDIESDIRISKNSSLIGRGNNLIGQGCRIFVHNHWTMGAHSAILTHCSIFSREPGHYGKLVMGDNSHIGDHTIVDISDDIIIGNNVAIGPNCTLYTHDHIYTDKNVPAWKGGLIKESIIIEDDCWIGSNVTLLPGIKIGEHSVIAAGSVVNKNVPSYSIWGGIPAKEIKRI